MIFQTVKQAADEIKRRIEELSAEYGLGQEQYHGIIKVYYMTDSADQFLHEENFVTRHDGEIIFAQKHYYRQNSGNCPHTEITDSRFPYWEITWKIPYPSGNIVTVRENPFFPSIKGVLVNSIEPDEADFVGDRYNQCCSVRSRPIRNRRTALT